MWEVATPVPLKNGYTVGHYFRGSTSTWTTRLLSWKVSVTNELWNYYLESSARALLL